MSATEFDLYEKPPRPSVQTWLKHAAFLLVTLVTATIAGVLYPFGTTDTFPNADPQTWSEIGRFVSTIPERYAAFIAGVLYNLATNIEYLKYGLSFSLSLLFILISHEMGHYVACRIYRVDATLPYFIPTPPLVGPAGTFGAFIKIRSPMPSRRAVFDIGVAGPIAGFIALIPIAIIGVVTMQTVPPEFAIHSQSQIVFADPLMMKAIAYFFGIDLHFGIGNPFYFAAWVGLLVTALNLIPSGQLDGGHAIYAVLGKRTHYWTGRVAFVVMAALSILGWIYYNSPSGFLIAVLLGVMMRIPHPDPWDQTPLGLKRKIIAFATLMIFILCFLPFPIQIS
ncbi:MAG TPA: site-2 protease family protein [Pyrinomonadaceae bacterium]|nr:site-2 protease family protein [Pyrinomonadaceae bacterium]